MVDVHLHTRFSFDSEEEPENYIKSARKKGVNVIGFSEHYDYDAYLDGEDISLADIPAYFENAQKLKIANPNMDILYGIEFGYRMEALPKYRELLKKYPFDYVINSLHTLPERGDCYHDKFFEGKTLKKAYNDYFNGVLESVKADYDYQIVGHIGYACRYRTGAGSSIKYADFADILDEILIEIIRRKKCLEINTSNGAGGCTFLPDTDIVSRYVGLGGKLISFGSDAHTADKYYKNAEMLKQFLKSLGINTLYYYKERKPVGYKI